MTDPGGSQFGCQGICFHPSDTKVKYFFVKVLCYNQNREGQNPLSNAYLFKHPFLKVKNVV